jgi:hypothetical protein
MNLCLTLWAKFSTSRVYLLGTINTNTNNIQEVHNLVGMRQLLENILKKYSGCVSGEDRKRKNFWGEWGKRTDELVLSSI